MAIVYVDYEARHLDAVVALCGADGWPSFPADPARAHRALNPGVTTVVAVDDDEVVGFAYLLSDGEIQAYLATMAVRTDHRRQGVGRQLIIEALARGGGERVDLLSDADAFYEALPHQRWTGFRLYPSGQP